MALRSWANMAPVSAYGLVLAATRSASRTFAFSYTYTDNTGRQLLEERRHPERKVRRRTFQSIFSFDIFMRQLRTTTPDFATYFTNHVASSMHRYWAAAYPSDYETYRFDDEWRQKYQGEIAFTMGTFDTHLGRLMEYLAEHPEYDLWVTSSMGQNATETRPLETELAVDDLGKFMKALGVPAHAFETRPAMLPQINVVVADTHKASFLAQLQHLRIAGHPFSYREKDAGFISMDFGHPNLQDLATPLEFEGQAAPLSRFGLQPMKIEDKCGANAYHIPQGSLLIYHGGALARPQSQRSEISTLDIAPALLENFAVPRPGYMRKSQPLAAKAA